MKFVLSVLVALASHCVFASNIDLLPGQSVSVDNTRVSCAAESSTPVCQVSSVYGGQIYTLCIRGKQVRKFQNQFCKNCNERNMNATLQVFQTNGACQGMEVVSTQVCN
jgi:hypothetical protein